ncbi:hypothetical protein EZS27_021982 [termite gut metagenome]|uniref:HNH endonuclease n=1 Tax=termite gut metagenome TaxID=433724 RepID=A0A5J4R5B9_9ZZZZ
MYTTEETQKKVWEKGTVIEGFDPYIWRKDFAGAWIRKDLYGTTDDYGWNVTAFQPYRLGGTSSEDNLIPIHWKNEVEKGDNYRIFRTSISNNGKIVNGKIEVGCNVEYGQIWEIDKQIPKKEDFLGKIKSFFKIK